MESAKTNPSALDFGDPAVRGWSVVYVALMVSPLVWAHFGFLSRLAAVVERVLRFIY